MRLKRMVKDKKSRKIAYDSTKHYPNKNESNLLRRIMAETQLNEEQIRSIKKYRQMLAEASKAGHKQKFNQEEKHYRGLIKEACKKTALAKEHPLTLYVLEELLQTSRNSIWRPWYLGRTNSISAIRVVQLYGKKK